MEAILRRKFQFTDLVKNNNKYWQIEVYPDGWLQTEFGRVGVINPPARKMGDIYDADKLIREKLRKGYVEVQLHKPVVSVVNNPSASSINSKVQELVNMIYAEAGKQQQTYLSVGIDELSQSQIDDARKVLVQISKLYNEFEYVTITSQQIATFAPLVQLFYTLIPTKLPAKIDPLDVTNDFLIDISSMEARLNQLSASLAGHRAQTVNKQSGIEALGGVQIEHLDVTRPERLQIAYMVTSTRGVHNIQIADVFSIKIPSERKAYEDNDFGKSNQEYLFHGTNNYNLQFILASGLICPRIQTHGRFYGNGIYFANRAQKSINYTKAQPSSTRTLLVSQVALGNQYVQNGSCFNRNLPPNGYHSLKSANTPSGMDELIVYKEEQSTISYLVTFK